MRSEIVDIPTPDSEVEPAIQDADSLHEETEKHEHKEQRQDAFGDEADAEIKYKVLKWWYVTTLSNNSPIY
jgi:hypothetical protein